MWVRYKQACLVIIGLIFLSSVLCSHRQGAAAEISSNWLVDAAPSLNKVADLPENTQPVRTNVDCVHEIYTPSLPEQPKAICTFASPLGTLTTDGEIRVGTEKLVSISGPTYQSFFMPTVDSGVAVVSISAPTTGNRIGIYRHLTKAALRLHKTINEGTYYDVASSPDEMLRNPVTHEFLSLDTESIAYSANGEWMVADMPHWGLVRISMEDLSTKLFTGSLEPESYLGLADPALAISNDGRYVAANTSIFGDGNITVYDTTTCEDQLNVAGTRHYCTSKDIWDEGTSTGQPNVHGVLGKEPDLQLPTHLSFINDDSLSFAARYQVSSPTMYKAATFVATAPGGATHRLGLLGMGDSYISGQGAFNYRFGTDTSNNGCHLSELSYPFVLGGQNFSSYNSVACSGATTSKIIGSDPAFKGQVKDGIKENKRDKASILTNFQPGYIYQQEFASTYLPESILLSVGGDDVGFADIVKQCVANEGGGTCYDTYEDRAELIDEINSLYPILINTYMTLREQSGGARLYTVGYPQIAKPGGDCGANVHLNSEEVVFSAQLISYLDSIIQRASATAGVFYVDTEQAFDGHRLCEAGDKAINGLTAGSDAGVTIGGKTVNFIGAESYHPTVLGYQLLAQTIAAKTKSLTAPMPVPGAYSVPQFDPNVAILRDVPSTGRPIRSVRTDKTILDDIVLRGDAQQVTVDGAQVQLQPGSEYQIVLHPTPVVLDEGGVDADGNINSAITIPADTVPGYHVLHIYGTNMAGEAVDIQKTIYVAAASDMPGSANSCPVVPASGQDADHDGIDDACDATIATISTADISGSLAIGGEGKTTAAPSSKNEMAAKPAGASSITHVLGATVDSTSRHNIKPPAVSKIAFSNEKLFRLDWAKAFEAWFMLMVCATACRAMWRRLH